MPHHLIPGTDQRYALIAFDEDGNERTDDPEAPGGRFSDAILAAITAAPAPPTDVFFFCHGWKGDMPRALEQYDAWLAAQAAQTADAAEMARRAPGFAPLRIGLHWPSQPWGDEELGGGDAFSVAAGAVPGAGVAGAMVGAGATAAGLGPRRDPVAALVERYVARLGDTPEIRADLTVIAETARDHAAAVALPPAARDAYARLDAALDLGARGEGAPPEADREPFDPDEAFALGQAAGVSYGGFGFGGILGPLRQLSFWSMKKRARSVGEVDMHGFLVRLLGETPARVHLMGHSFGCIVVSAMLGGPGGEAPLPRPVASVVLVQGALSLWSYCPSIPHRAPQPGYFHQIIAAGKVSGPVVTTRTRHDTAVGKFYPLAAQWAGPQSFGPGDGFPPHGGVGAFGIQGLDAGIVDRPMLAATEPYAFPPGTITNLESSDFIRDGGGPSGAHSDIAGPEVAHAIWQAALPQEG